VSRHRCSCCRHCCSRRCQQLPRGRPAHAGTDPTSQAAAAAAVHNIAGTDHPSHSHITVQVFGPGLLMSCRASSWVSAAAGNCLGVLDWCWIYKLTRHTHCIVWRPLRTISLVLQPCLHVIPLITWRSPMYVHRPYKDCGHLL